MTTSVECDGRANVASNLSWPFGVSYSLKVGASDSTCFLSRDGGACLDLISRQEDQSD